MRTVLVTLVGPDHTADLVVDADTPVAELMPQLTSAVMASATAAEADHWTLAVTGREPVSPGQTLDEAGVLDGAVLVLRRADRPSPGAVVRPLNRGEAGSPLARTRAAIEDASRRQTPGAPAREVALSADAGLHGLERIVADAKLSRCVTIAFVSPKGGVGKTTLSILLGEALCAFRADQILALDGDGDYGSLGRVSQLASGAPGRRDDTMFAALAGGAVTFAELNRTLWALPGGLRIVPSPRDPAAMARADRAAYARVIGNLQRLCSVLIVDCGTGLGQPGVQAAILASDQLVLVTDASGATASLAVEAFGLLERSGRQIIVAGNRLRRGRAGEDDLARLDASFPRAAGLVGIPDEPDAGSALAGDMRLEQASRTLRQGVTELAAALAAHWARLSEQRPRADSV
ncbi:MAG: AAA family ATPase [Conexibacteraceae bacterium]|nr:AAA family ATPase [Conexibacteraceae bacterium]